MSNIEWTGDTWDTWNPIVGCSRISDGCKNCYAETMTKRLEAMGQAKYAGLLNAQGRFNGVTRFDEDALLKPLKRKKPTTYFVNSMSDLFHESIPDEWIDKVFAVMAACPQHTFQVLTKRAFGMETYCGASRVLLIDRIVKSSIYFPITMRIESRMGVVKWPLPNVWLGVSAENQEQADARIPHLLNTPAAVRFVSAEPLLGKIDFTNFLKTSAMPDRLQPGNVPVVGLDWIIVGGESGAGARPCRVEWIRSIVRQCKTADVPVFVKQMGGFIVDRNDAFGYEPNQWNLGDLELVMRVEHDINGYREEYQGADCRIRLVNKKGGDMSEWPEDLRIREIPK